MVELSAACPTCGEVFPSRISIDGPGIFLVEGNEVQCPNGHMGVVPSGYYRIYNGILSLTPTQVDEVKLLAEAVRRGQEDAQASLNKIADFLPPESAAAIKQLGANNPLTAVLLVLAIIASIAASCAGAYRALVPADPSPPPVIHNHVTVINNAAPRDERGDAIGKPPKKEQIRRLRQLERQKEKLKHQKGHKAEYTH